MEKVDASAPAIEENVHLEDDVGAGNDSATKSKVFLKKVKSMFYLDRSEIKNKAFEFAAAFLNVVSVLVLISTLPSYLQKSNQSGGSTYTSLFVGSLFVALSLLVLSLLKRIWDSSFQFRSGLPLKVLLKHAVLQSVGTVFLFQSQDRHRVPCHFQDSLFLLCVPVAFIVNFFIAKTSYVCWTRKLLIGYGIFMAALFMGVNLQLADRFQCRGFDWSDPTSTFGGWTWETNILWMLIRATGLCLWTTGFTLTIVFCSGERGKHRYLEIFTWISVFSFCVVTSFCWIDTFASLGKGSTWQEFSISFANGFQCHFSTAEDCVRTSATSFVFYVAWLLFLLTSALLTKCFNFTAVLLLSCSSLALPLTSIWWSIFSLDQEQGLQFHPQLGANFVAAAIALPIACCAYIYCLRKYQNIDSVFQPEVKSPNV